MLFATTINQVQGTIASISTEIDEMQKRIELLREQKLALESHLQQLGSAESAAESAIEQTRTAITMIEAISPTELSCFQAALNELFKKPGLLGANISETTQDLSDNVTNYNPEDLPEDLTVTAEEVSETDDEPVSDGHEDDIIETKTEQVVVNLTNGNGKAHLTLSDFKSYTLTQLKKIASAKGVKTKQGKDALANDLSTLHLSQKDIDKLLG